MMHLRFAAGSLQLRHLSSPVSARDLHVSLGILSPTSTDKHPRIIRFVRCEVCPLLKLRIGIGKCLSGISHLGGLPADLPTEPGSTTALGKSFSSDLRRRCFQQIYSEASSRVERYRKTLKPSKTRLDTFFRC